MEYIGNINKKMINGRNYYYHQYRINGKMLTKIISDDEAYDLSFKISYSREYDLDDFLGHSFKTDLSTGSKLYSLEKSYLSYKKRFIFHDIENYLGKDTPGKVLILYGLRRTGKTTLIYQTLLSLSLKEHAKAAFIRINRENSYSDLKDDLDYLTTHGFKYIFIDEVTLLDNFISIASVFSDIYGTRSKIILSGTDSLGLYIAKFEELFDRAIFLHTTYISFKEYSEVLGIDSIDTYIEYGGTMSIETNNYNNTPLNYDNYLSYIDSAIANNITHSLKNYRNGDHFSHLYKLYEKGELNNAINRIIEDQNHRFAISVIDREFKSNDYGSLKDLLAKSEDESIRNALTKVNEEQIIKTLSDAFSIIKKEKQKVLISEEIISEVEAYLDVLDVVKEVEEIHIASQVSSKKKVVIQPGIRFSQAKVLLDALLSEEHVKNLPLPIIDVIKEKLLDDIKGRMLEEIVLYQTSKTNPNTFKLLFTAGEFDMVTIDKYNRYSSIFEIKHSSVVHERQYAHINDESKIKEFENKYYPIKNKIVLYNGLKNLVINNDIRYLNVGWYLKNINEFNINNGIEAYCKSSK